MCIDNFSQFFLHLKAEIISTIGSRPKYLCYLWNFEQSFVLSETTFYGNYHPINLTNLLFNNQQPLINNFTLLYFLSAFKNNKYIFSPNHLLTNPRKFDNQILTKLSLKRTKIS